jgi:hypothetical protein
MWFPTKSSGSSPDITIRTIHVPVKKTSQMLRSIKKLCLKVSGVYCVPCECREVYIGQAGRSIGTRCKEQMRYKRLGQSEKSVVAEHRFKTGHSTVFSNTTILDKATGCMDRIIKEAIEITFN